MKDKSFVGSFKVYLIFTASGATALVYQVIWARWLGLVFGNTTTSISIVLGSFMLGLALGSWAAGRLLHRISDPMRAYAVMELGIGVFAFCFPFLLRATDFLFPLLVGTDSPLAYGLFVRAIFTFALLLVPTTFMGATLPLLTDFFRRSPRHGTGWKVGVLYAVNTFGAALGIVVGSFFLIELLGVSLTTYLAASLNFLIAFLGYRFSVNSTLTPAGEREETGAGARLDSMGKMAVAVLAATGAVALASEVLWTRTLETVIGNSTYAFATIVLVYLVGIAAGSWAMSLAVTRLKRLPLWLATLCLGMGIWMLAAISILQGLIDGFSAYSGLMVDLSVMFSNYLRAVSVLVPLSLLSGACFPLATRIIEPSTGDASGGLIARAYFWNTAGAVTGSLLAGFLVAPLFDYFDSLYVMGLLYCALAALTYLFIALSRWEMPYKRPALFPLAALSALLVVFAVSMVKGESRFVQAFNSKNASEKVIFHEPGLQGVTSVIQHVGQPTAKSLLVNGMGMTVKITDTKIMAHLPMILHPDPRNTLVICFGMGTTYRSAISYGAKVTVVELVQEVLDAFDYFYLDAGRVRDYPGGRMVTNDGRNFLKLTEERFDVITIDPPPPIDAAGVTHLYSREFIELARSRLTEGGIMAHWIPYWWIDAGVDDKETYLMLVKTFADVFPYVYGRPALNKVGLHILGSMKPIEVSDEHIRGQLARSEVRLDLNEWDTVPEGFFAGLKPIGKLADDLRMVTDDRPLLEFYLVRTARGSGSKRYRLIYW